MATSKSQEKKKGATDFAGYVVALRDFKYDVRLGKVYAGQLFELAGNVNDAGLARHRFVAEFDPSGQPPVQDSLGRWFATDWQRERANDMETLTPAELQEKRRAQAAERREAAEADGRRLVVVGE